MALVHATLAAEDRTRTATTPSSSEHKKESQEQVNFIQERSNEASGLCSEPASLNCDSAKQEKQCAIHTKHFSDTCSQECFDTMAAVNVILNTHTPLCPEECDLQ